MTYLRKRIAFAGLAGISFSALLFALQFLPPCFFADSAFLFVAQSPGFIVAASIWGWAARSGGYAFVAVMVVVNAFFYGLAIWGLLSLGGRPKATD
jgi:hypothetical protein